MTEKEKELGQRVINLEKELEATKKKLAEEERAKWVKDWYDAQKGSGDPPYPHF